MKAFSLVITSFTQVNKIRATLPSYTFQKILWSWKTIEKKYQDNEHFVNSALTSKSVLGILKIFEVPPTGAKNSLNSDMGRTVDNMSRLKHAMIFPSKTDEEFHNFGCYAENDYNDHYNVFEKLEYGRSAPILTNTRVLMFTSAKF